MLLEAICLQSDVKLGDVLSYVLVPVRNAHSVCCFYLSSRDYVVSHIEEVQTWDPELVMLVDSSGALRPNRQVNTIASTLGSGLVYGNALLVGIDGKGDYTGII